MHDISVLRCSCVPDTQPFARTLAPRTLCVADDDQNSHRPMTSKSRAVRLERGPDSESLPWSPHALPAPASLRLQIETASEVVRVRIEPLPIAYLIVIWQMLQLPRAPNSSARRKSMMPACSLHHLDFAPVNPPRRLARGRLEIECTFLNPSAPPRSRRRA